MNFIDRDCPFCNKKTKSNDLEYHYRGTESYLNILKDEHYFKGNLEDFNKVISKNLKLVECDECKISFFKKWFDEITVRKIYMNKPHRLGWGSFNLFYNNDYRLKKYIEKKIKIFSILKKKIPNISDYAELNCPFSGQMLLFNFYLNNKKYKINILEKLKKEKHYYPNFILKFINKLVLLYYEIAIFYENFKDKFFKRKIKKKSHFEEKISIPSNINLIELENNSYSWNYGCNNLGHNCRKVYSYFEGFKTINFKDIDQKNFKFDLSYLENTLDHIKDLNYLLGKLTKISKNLAVITHGRRAGPQHFFYLNQKFFENYCKKNNLKLHILTKEFSEKENNDFDNQFYLISEIK